MDTVRKIVVAGGGTAGWMAAGALAARFKPNHPGGLKVVLVEAPDIPTIGVGEGTWPSMRDTLQAMGIAETDFLMSCDAAFKQASRFQDWLRPGHAYYHPFMVPRRFDELNLAEVWSEAETRENFADFVSFQPALCDQDRAPKMASTPDFEPIANYAYHLDAGKFADFLKAHCLNRLGVEHISGRIAAVRTDDDDYITALTLDDSRDVEGDLFLDCTGFHALLIGKQYGAPVTDVKDQLFVDTALAMQVPYDDNAPIRSATCSTAQPAGWIWDISLQSRRGTGYVYSSAFTSEDEARATLAAYIGKGPEYGERARRIGINSGYRPTPWIKNCVAVGLSMGFVEPLEASSIVMIELALKDLMDRMPASRADIPALARAFNTTFAGRWAAIVDFLKLHYLLSRRDEPFWVANRDTATVSPSLRELLELWKTRTPGVADFPHRAEIFPAASYQYVLYGMEYQTHVPAWRTLRRDLRKIELARDEVERARGSIGRLPTNRAFFDALTARRISA